MRVLLAEDRHQDRELLATALRERGMEVIVAAARSAAWISPFGEARRPRRRDPGEAGAPA